MPKISKVQIITLLCLSLGGCLPKPSKQANLIKKESDLLPISLLSFSSPLPPILLKPNPFEKVKKTVETRANSVTLNNKLAARRQPPPSKSIPPQRRQMVRKDFNDIVEMFHGYASRVLRAGRHFRRRRKILQRRCNANPYAMGCSIWRNSRKLFAYNYRTKSRNYRGYMMFHRKNKRTIPRSLMRWYDRVSRRRYWRSNPRCYLHQGLLTNCMSFAVCTHQAAMRHFRGEWGRGFNYPYWGVINYLVTQAYHEHYEDYVKDGASYPGAKTLLKEFPNLDWKTKRSRSALLLSHMYDRYMALAKRKLRSKFNEKREAAYGKAFCTTTMVGVGKNTFKRAIPGDIFVKSYLRKRKLTDKLPRLYLFQHWGIITTPEKRRVIHNQTPGGVWGTSYTKWGIQYGRYKVKVLEERWKKIRRRWRRREYEKSIFFSQRVNIHYYVYSRKQGASVYDFKDKDLCRNWIREHGDIYFSDLRLKPPSDKVAPKMALK